MTQLTLWPDWYLYSLTPDAAWDRWLDDRCRYDPRYGG